jgi:alkylhydroperoxidase/carboxymuconolactone decarboxylase family protein YurZ
MAATGMKVKLTLVNGIKYSKSAKRGKRRARSVHAAARRASATVAGVTIEQLIEIKKFVDSFGGADQVRGALDLLAQLK